MEDTNNEKVCPICKTLYSKSDISCERCGITLMKVTNYLLKYGEDPHTYPQNIKNNNTVVNEGKTTVDNDDKKGKVITKILVIVTIIIGIIIIVNTAQKSNEPKTFVDDKRCYWCSKVIRADGRNIHGTPTDPLGHIIKCEYCGHENVIVE